jgi:hypothetical protein
MANCRYCGKPAGFLRRQHAECRRQHDVAAAKIPKFFVEALHSPMDAGRFHELVDRDTAQNFVGAAERDELVHRGLGAMIHAALADGALTDTANARIHDLQKTFGISMEQLGADGTALLKARILLALEEGKLNRISIAVDGPLAPRLESEERILWSFSSARYLTMRSHTHYVGGSSGVSIRIMRGVYYHASTFRSQPVKADYLSDEDSGALTVTTENLYFVGHKKALKIPRGDIMRC